MFEISAVHLILWVVCGIAGAAIYDLLHKD